MHTGKNWSLVKPNNIYVIALISILLFSAFLNFYHLKERSLLDWDEAYYLEVIKTWRAGTSWFVYRIIQPEKIANLTFSDYILKNGGAVNTFAKDGFLAILFFSSLFVGLRDITVLWVNSIFGVLTLWVVYLIGKEALNRLAALLSCMVLATSVYHLHYARSGFPQTTSVFFLYLAIYIYILSHKQINNAKISNKFLFFSAITLGFAFSCHYSLFPALPVFFICEIAGKALFKHKISLTKLLKRLSLLTVGILIPILFFGGISELIKANLYSNPHSVTAIRGSLGIGEFVSYFGRIRNFLTPFLLKATFNNNTFHAKEQINPFFYLRLLFIWEGASILILLSIGILRLVYRQLRQRAFFEFVILALFLALFIFWSLHPWKLSRSFLAAIPAVAMIIGGLLAQILEKICKTETTKAASIFIILIVLISQAHKRIGQELSFVSGYPAAIEFMRGHLGIKHLSSQFTISRFFSGRENALDISVSFAGGEVKSKLKKLYSEESYKYLLLDQMRIIFADSPIVQAADRSNPVFISAHSIEANLFENDFPDFSKRVYKMPKVLMVYKLDDIIGNVKE